MKQFACGDVVPGCDATFVCSTVEELLALVAAHAGDDHGLVELPDELAVQVRDRVVTLV